MSIEIRFARTLRTDPQPAGRTTVDVECPFCECVTQARAWSLAGSGKRCAGGCGAVLSGKGIGMAVATRSTDPSEERTDGSAS
ncbi:MAG: hypothetical protein J0H96_05765 [Microbacterium ginsengisoli]|nr:hypothetical protein [Microbacterium ginsengisoli]